MDWAHNLKDIFRIAHATFLLSISADIGMDLIRFSKKRRQIRTAMLLKFCICILKKSLLYLLTKIWSSFIGRVYLPEMHEY